jgi:hypothetical protein
VSPGGHPLAEPPEDPADLADFPSVEKDRLPGLLFRIHRVENDPAFFSDDEHGRFNPLPNSPAGFGTCYLSISAVGAYVETFGRIGTVSQRQVDQRAVSAASVSSDLRLADMTAPTILGDWGLTADVGCGPDYGPTQRWAERLYQANFHGIWYRARHDLGGGEDMRSVALFGGPGLRPDELEFAFPGQRIPEDLISYCRRQFGIVVLPTASTA